MKANSYVKSSGTTELQIALQGTQEGYYSSRCRRRRAHDFEPWIRELVFFLPWFVSISSGIGTHKAFGARLDGGGSIEG